MPYRIDFCCPPVGAVDVLVHRGALDIESTDLGIAALMPDDVTPDSLAGELGVSSITVSAAIARDNNSVWLLSQRPVRIGNVLIVPPAAAAPQEALRLTDSSAFGTGHHPTTALCIESLSDILTSERLDSVLDVGTGSGILALVALKMGVPHAVGLDTDAEALRVAARNARLNQLEDRLQLVVGGPDALPGNWPLVVANLLAAPLMDLAPLLARRVGRRGRLILSGIHSSLESEVRRTYQHLGFQKIASHTHAGWTMLLAQASW